MLGVDICLRNWIGAFLTSRLQCVTINGTVSTLVFPQGGLSQLGTRLAPLLFSVLVNRLVGDWPYRVKCVDDTSVYEVTPRCSPSCLPYVASDISHLAAERGMLLISKKCHELIMIIVLQFQPDKVSELQLMGSAIKSVHSYKILGVHVSDDLTWNTHID